MQIHRDLSSIPTLRNPVVTTGSFDGVHAGHQRLITRINELARQYDGESVVVTYDPHPREVVFPRDDSLRLLTSTAEKAKLLEDLGVDHLVIVPFTVEFSQMSPREYIEKFLMGALALKCLVIGYDHRFGLNRSGDFRLLKEYSDAGAFDIIVIDKHEVNDIAISSSRIREALQEGRIKDANQLLGHTYGVRGKVVHGEKIGNQIGFPTANIEPDTTKKLLPPSGIYASYAVVDGTRHKAMLYIGSKPTLSKHSDKLVIEVNIIDFTGDLYEESLEIEIVQRIRDDQEYSSLEELRRAIADDQDKILEVLKAPQAERNETLVALAALNYNGIGVIEQCLPSWTRASEQNTRLVFIDNASTDDSVDYIREHFSEFELVLLQENTGYAGGYNRGLEKINNKYYALVNSDVELTDGWLAPIIELMESNPDIAACQPKILNFNKRDEFEYAGACGGFMDKYGIPFCAGRILGTTEKDNGQYDDIQEIFWATGAAFVIRSDVFKQFGGFDEDYFAHMEEIDLCWRIKRAGYRIVSVPQSHIFHIGGGTLPYNNPNKVFLNFRNNISTLIKNVRMSQLIWILLVRLILDTVASLHFILQGQFRQGFAVVRAYFAVIGMFGTLMRKRRQTKQMVSSHSIGPSDRSGILNKSILWQYYGRGRRTMTSMNFPKS